MIALDYYQGYNNWRWEFQLFIQTEKDEVYNNIVRHWLYIHAVFVQQLCFYQ